MQIARSLILSLGLTLVLSLCAFGQTVAKTLVFTKGKASASGSIKGSATHNYTVTLKKGAKLTVKLVNKDNTVYFNLLPKGSETAIFNGSINGNSYSGSIAKDGQYVISVYQMRASARRVGSHLYQLSVQSN